MSIIAWLVVGLVAGWIANLIMSSGRGGLLSDLVIGILGAIIGGCIMGSINNTDYTTGINIPTLLVAIGGAIRLPKSGRGWADRSLLWGFSREPGGGSCFPLPKTRLIGYLTDLSSI